MRIDLRLVVGCVTAFVPACQQPGGMSQGGGKYQKIKTAAELKTRMDADENLLVIHAVDADHYAAGHVPGAVNINFETMTPEMLPADKDRPLVFYCVSPWCPVSRKAAARAAAWGHKNVWAYVGGIKDWKAAGMKVETGK